jgi:intracellular sulfur oxidation DsrE/DsrF family protein
MKQDISDEMLGAYVDDELGADEKAHLLDRFATDASIRSRACELWQLKQMMRSAYTYTPSRSKKNGLSFRATTGRLPMAIAATCLMLVGMFSGWLAHERQDALRPDGLTAHQMDSIRANSSKVVLHLVSDEPERMEAALRMAEELASAKDRNGRPIQVELIANGPGVHLLRAGGSSYSERVVAQRLAHPNLQLLACRQTMDKLRERGVAVNLLSVVQEAPSAERVLAARLSQGWRYIQA